LASCLSSTRPLFAVILAATSEDHGIVTGIVRTKGHVVMTM
jgi:hypothetical protein